MAEQTRICSKCGAELTDKNWPPSWRRKKHYICKGCHSKRTRQFYWKHREKELERGRKNIQLNPEYRKKYYKKNKDKIFAQNKEWAKEHPDIVKQTKKSWKLRNKDKIQMYNKLHPRKYDYKKSRIQHLKKRGLTLADYDKLFEKQQGVCAICDGVNTDGRRLFIDHNHITGGVRGLLCNQCNALLGYAKDNPATLTKAANYLYERDLICRH